MEIRGSVQVKLNTGLVRQKGRDIAYEITSMMLNNIVAKAKHNLTPGIGPGPHPHVTPHKDTGEGTKNIWGYINRGEDAYLATFGTFLYYLLHLEFGYHARSGKFVRYPWLEPAIRETERQAQEMAQGIFKRYGLTMYGSATFRHVTSSSQRLLSGFGKGTISTMPLRS